MLHDNLSRIIRWYKGRVAFESHQVDACFDWQPRFYDHIIRNEQEYLNISNYISNNPRNWRENKLFQEMKNHCRRGAIYRNSENYMNTIFKRSRDI